MAIGKISMKGINIISVNERNEENKRNQWRKKMKAKAKINRKGVAIIKESNNQQSKTGGGEINESCKRSNGGQ